MLKQFKPTLLFLVKFALVFIAGSLLYGAYIKKSQAAVPPSTDAVTHWVAKQVNALTRLAGKDAHLWYPENEPLVVVYVRGFESDNVTFYEGCNGINIMILFIAFVVAFGNRCRRMLWFIPLGLVAIHIFNLLRLVSLTLMATFSHSVFHFFHKYAFTGIIYAFVLFLWYLWATHFGKPVRNE